MNNKVIIYCLISLSLLKKRNTNIWLFSSTGRHCVIMQPVMRGSRQTLLHFERVESQKRLGASAVEYIAECVGSMCWLCAVWSRQACSSASLCQTEVQRCLVWLRSLFDQAVSGILTDLCSGQMERSPHNFCSFFFLCPFQCRIGQNFAQFHSILCISEELGHQQYRCPYCNSNKSRGREEWAVFALTHLLLFVVWFQPRSKVYSDTTSLECERGCGPVGVQRG